MTTDRQDDWGDDGELRARLDAYAASRLKPDAAATARTRAIVMVQAHGTLGAARAAGDVAGPGLFRRLLRRPARAASAVLLALAVVAVGTVAASGPGGPLYGARLWVETLTLPSDANARAAAELERLQARVNNATAAAANGNGGAVTAALDAYRQTLVDAFAAAGSDPTREQRLAAELGRHLAVLGALAARVPANAGAAIDQAVQRTESRINAMIGAPGQSIGAPAQSIGAPGQGNPNGTPKPGNPNPGNAESGQPGPHAEPGQPERGASRQRRLIGAPSRRSATGAPAPGPLVSAGWSSSSSDQAPRTRIDPGLPPRAMSCCTRARRSAWTWARVRSRASPAASSPRTWPA